MKLVPTKDPQKLSFEIWDQSTPYENKLELIDENAFWSTEERDNLLLALVYNVGLQHFINILPVESSLLNLRTRPDRLICASSSRQRIGFQFSLQDFPGGSAWKILYNLYCPGNFILRHALITKCYDLFSI